MTRVRKIGLSVMALLCALTLGFALAGCGGKDTEPTYGYGEEGLYYYSASEDTDYLLTLRQGTYILTFGTEGHSGAYEYSEGTLTLCSGDEEEPSTGTMTDSGISLTWEGRTYLFLRYEYYTVTFSDGGSTLSTQSVLNGKAAQDPGEPGKEGYVFLGWYADASFTERYEFNTSITGNTTIYARFIEVEGTTEYKVTYDFGDGETYTTETLNGRIYDLPEAESSGQTFIGWWVSATNSADELTYKYDGETLCEDTTLFAVYASGSYIGASIKDDGIYWENYNASVTEATLRGDDGTIVQSFEIQSTRGEYAYDFASLPAGKYTVEIGGGGVTETLTYVSNGLARASGFTVISGSILMYSPVENAESYYISIDCGTESHDHTYIDNGTSLYYDFSSCEMPAEGITFTVYAYAEGYYYSVSSYNYFLGLDKAEVTVEGSLVSWTPVSYAMQYEVYIDGILVATTSGTSWSLSEYGTGTYEVSVRPVTTGYYSEKSEAYLFTKTTLAAPKVTGIENYVVSWTEVEGAAGYKISIGGVETTVEEGITSLYLTEDNYVEGLDSYEISVKALAPDSANDSPYGEAITVTGTSVGSTVSYNDGTVTWQYSLSASEYRITVNDGDELIVTGTNSTAITLTKSGNNEITVYFVNDYNEIYGQASITVYAYAIVFDARGGTAYNSDGKEVDTIYVAKGDTVTLPDADRGVVTADFLGWYTLPDVTDDPDATAYQGDGYLFEDGTVFTGNSTIVLYAAWLNPRMNVKLNAGDGILVDGNGDYITETIISFNGRNYTIAVPESTDAAYVFYGWYSGENGTGTRYTDEEGNAVAPFSDESVTTLYAYWIQVLEITSASYNTSGADNVFSVTKGPDIGLVSEVTIPESYTVGGVEYTEGVISSSTAFSGCTKLKTINIPDTVIYINIVNNGYDSGAGAFNGTALESVNVYATGEPSTTKEIIYYSNDGVLFWINAAGDVELLYYPYGRTDETYTVPETVINENELELSGNREVQAVHYVNALGGSAFRGHTEITYMVIPECITVVGTYLFYNCTSLTGVEFAGEVEKLEDYMFYGCSSLTEFDIPYTVKELGNSVFRSCTGLTTFTIPEHVETIGTYTFYGCTNLKTVYLPSTLKKVNDYTFYNCQALTGIEFTYGVEEIGTYAFYGCSSLTQMTLPASVTTLDNYAFRNCTGLTEINISQELTTLGTYVFAGCSSLPSITLPEGLTTIGQYDFYQCYSLTQINLPDSLETIDKYAFEYCMALTSIVIPRNVDTINSQAFYGCYKLVEVYNLSSLTISMTSSSNGYVGYYAKVVHTSLDEPSCVIHDGGFIFIENSGGYSLIGYEGTDPNPVIPEKYADDIYEVTAYAFVGNTVIESLTLPDNIEVVGEYAFAYCTSLRSITLPDSIEEIGRSAFEECTSLKMITLPAALSEILSFCFYDCTSLMCITIPDNVSEIRSNAFCRCSSLLSVTIGKNVTYIWEDAFDDCTNIVEVVNLSSLNIVAGSSDNGFVSYYAKSVVTSEDDRHLAYEDGFLSVYDMDDNYLLLGYYGTETDIVLPDYIDGHTYEITDYAFDGMSSLTSVKIGAGVTKIGGYAFRNCTGLETVSFNAVLESIGNYAFYGCESLANITIPDSLKSIGRYAFDGTAFYEDSSNWDNGVFYLNTFLMGVDLSFTGELVVKDGITVIAGGACQNNTGVTSVVLPDTVVSIGDYAFYQCTSLTTINITPSVTYIGAYAFYGDTNLSIDLNLKGEELTMGTYAFYHSGITSFTACYNYIDIGTYAFYNVTSLMSVNFTGSKTIDIGNAAFQSCTGLESVILSDAVTEIAAYMFYGCSSIESIIIPDTVETIGQSAFYNCSSLVSITIPEFVTSIGTNAFYGCTALTEINYNATACADLTSASNYVFYNAGKNGTGITLTIGANVTKIPNYMFSPSSTASYAPNITCIIFEEGSVCESIGTYAFRNVSGFTSIELPASVKTIGQYAFYNCTGLESIILPDAVTSIATYTFYGCSSLEWIVIGADVESIGNYAFYNCSKLSAIYFMGDETAWDAISVGSNNSPLDSAMVYIYSATEPATDGNFWHYVDGEVVIWKKD